MSEADSIRAQLAALKARLAQHTGPTRRQALIGGAAMAGGSSGRLVPPMNAPRAAPITPGVQPGNQSPVVIANTVIVFGPVGKPIGVFVYQAGTRPAAGNPPIAWLTSGTRDPYGNPLPSTSGVAGSGTFEAGNTILKALGDFVYGGTPGVGNLIASITPAAGANDGFGNPFQAGVNAYVKIGAVTYAVGLNRAGVGNLGGLSIADTASAPNLPAGVFGAASNGAVKLARAILASGLVTNTDAVATVEVQSATDTGTANGTAHVQAGNISLGANSTVTVDDNNGVVNLQKPVLVNPAATGFAVFWSNANGTASGMTQSGLAGQLPLVQTDTSTSTNANNTTPRTLTAAYTIPANDAQAGTVYELEVPYGGTFENQTLQLGLSVDGSTIFTASSTVGAAFFVAGTAFNGTVRVRLHVLTTGAAGTVNAFVDGGIGISGNRSSGTNNNNAYLSGEGLAVALDTTVVHNIRVNSLWGGSAVGQTVSGHGSKFTRSGP